MGRTQKVHLPEWLTAGAAFVYYLIMALYKLTEAPIWQDEAMEFYCSLPIKGAIRGVTDYATMYERMAHIQQQPPLYNLVMCLWLQVNEGEWWFRFSSVVIGLVAAVGLYFVIRRLSNRYMAAFCVVIYSSIYILMYYIKEASEYVMLIMFLFWLIYLYLLLCEQITVKRIIVFTLLCVASVYTHYGAVFAVVPMAVSVLLQMIKQKNWKELQITIGAYAVSVLGAGIPLVYYFIIPQSANQVSTLASEGKIIIENGNIFADFLFSFASVFQWCTIDIDRDTEKIGLLLDAAIIVLAAILIFVMIRTEKRGLRSFFYCNIATFLIYYVITKLNIYAYGWYGNRYNMFIFPLWLVLIAASLYEFVIVLRQSDRKAMTQLSKLLQVGMIAVGILYCVYGDYRISNHWWKMDLRAVVDKWYEEEGYEIPTLVDFHQRYGFVYYFTHDERYDESQWENLKYNDDLESYTTNDTALWEKYLHEVYGPQLPQELYLVTGQWNTFAITFEKLGYQIEPVVDSTAKMYYMVFEPLQ